MTINKYDHFLMAACLSGNLELVKYLISCGANVSAYGEMPLKNACLSGNQKLVKFLLEKGADVTMESQEDEENCAFNNACRLGNYDLVKFFVKKNLYYDFKNQRTLYIACINKNKAMVEFLLSLGFSLLENAENCLMHAAKNRDINLINYLSMNDATLSKYGNKAFAVVCSFGNNYMVDYFLKNGFDPSSNKGEGLKCAILNKNFKIAEKLMPFYKLSDDEKIDLLERACMSRTLKLIKFLEKHYGDIKITTMALSLAR